MSSSSTRATKGYVRATLGGRTWETESVVFKHQRSRITVGGPDNDDLEESVFIAFPDTVQPGEHKMQMATQIMGWYNPMGNGNSWVPDENADTNTVTVHSVSVTEPEMTISFDFEVADRNAPDAPLKIKGKAKFSGASTTTGVYKRP